MHKLRNSSGDSEADLEAQLEDIVGDGRVYVLGLGNTDRADDGAGVLVAQALKGPFPSFAYSEHDGVEGTVLDLSERDEAAAILFVDAANLNLRPGSIRLVRRDDIKQTEITTHRVAVALMASILEKAGKEAAVICIQPGRIEFRGKVTSPVQEAIETVTNTLKQLMSHRD